MSQFLPISFFKRFKGVYSAIFLLLAVVTVFACSSGSNGRGGSAGGITIGDDGDFDPVGDESPLEPGNEACENTDTVSISPTKIDFGLSEKEAMECQTVSVTACLTFSAEIDDSSALDENDSPIFVLANADGEEASNRLTNQEGGVQVCYKRTSEGTHKGQVNIVVSGASATYASVIPLSGTTVGYMFLDYQPTDGQLVWEKAPEITAYDGANFTIPSSGTVNILDLSSIITSNEMTIAVDGGDSQTLTYGSNGSFSTSINIPNAPAVYPVSFSVETAEGMLTKTVDVIRYTAPSGSIQVRDSSGSLISAVGEDEASATDSSVLMAGINVENLDVSGPSVVLSDGTTDEINPVTITLQITKPEGEKIYWNGEKQEWSDSEDDLKSFDFYNNFDDQYVDADKYETIEDCKGEIFSEPEFTFCIPLPPTADLGKGTNTITANVCNDYKVNDGDTGCTEFSATIVVSNDVPIITINTPVENQVYDENSTVTLTGSVQNYEDKAVDEEGNETCLVKLWLNTAVGQTAVDLCDHDGFTVVANEDGAESGGNRGNIRKATFSIDLGSLTDSNGNHALTLYTNLVLIEAQNSSGHVAYKVVSFQRGDLNGSSLDPSFSGKKMSLTGDLTTGQLGELSSGAVERAPLMINISEGTLNTALNSEKSTENLIQVIEKFLNDNVHFEDLVQGYSADDDGDIPGEIESNSHLSGVAKVMSWIENGRKNFNPSDTDNACNYHTEGTCASILFIKNLDDDRLFGDDVNEEDFWSPVVFGKRNEDGKLLDTHGNVIRTKANGWPEDDDDIDDIAPDYDFNDIEQGKFTVDKIDFENDGKLTAHITLHGFKGHAIAFAMCEYGAMSFPPSIPIVFNIDQLKIRLDDIQIKKIQLDSQGNEYFLDEKDEHGNSIPENRTCTGGNCSNKLIIDPDNIQLEGNSNDSIYMSASHDCADENVGAIWSDDAYYEPFGCDLHEDFVDAGFDEYYWMLLETRNELDYLTMAPGPSLIVLLQEVLRNTFKDMLACDIPVDMVNPLFDSNAFPYHYTPENQRISDFTMALDNTDDGAAFALLEDAKNPLFTFTPNLKEADIVIQNGGLSLKLPLSMGATGVSSSLIQSFIRNSSSVTTRKNGYMYREFDSASPYSYPPAAVENTPYLGLSLGIEEFLHAATHVLWKKGFGSVLDLIDPDLADDLEMTNDWTVGIDKVTLGRLGICDQVAIMKADLPPAQLFASIEEFFSGSDAVHLDISVDKNQSPTLAIIPVEGKANTVTVQLGLTNVQVDVKNLEKTEDDKYRIGSSVVKLRLDLLLRLVLSYDAASRKLEVYVLPLDETPIYISVINRGNIYDDSAVVQALRYSILPSTWANFEAAYNPTSTENSPSLAFILPEKVTGFDNSMTVTSGNMDEAEGFEGLVIENNTTASAVGECEEGNEPQYASRFKFGGPIVGPVLNGISWFHPANGGGGNGDSDGGSSDDGEGGKTGSPIGLKPGAVEVAPFYGMDDPCWMFNNPITDNDIKEMLCDFGIKEITLKNGPDLEFDYVNGYLHLSTELAVEIYDWLTEEVTP
ncbi:MAG: hypothetical protein HY541_08925 [Deltaproteobacteria bacterium]|nr:hypothetical protein [Deltaproteobacteria bacterium]